MLRVNAYRYHQPPAPLGALTTSPGQFLDALKAVDSNVAQLDADIQRSAASPSFKDGWNRFRAEWAEFYNSNATGVTGYLSRFWGGSLGDLITEYRQRLDDWRKQFQSQGGAPTAPALPGLDTGPGGIPWTTIGLVAVGAFAASRLLGRRRD